MKQSADLKPKKIIRELKLEMIAELREEFGSSQLADLLERGLSEGSPPKEIRVVGTVAPKK